MVDDFFDDPFEDLVNQFIRGARGSRGFQNRKEISEDENGDIEVIGFQDKIFIILELPGYDEKDVDIEFKGKTLIVTAKKKEECKMQDYLSRKLCTGEQFKKTLPDFINLKNFKSSFKNGVLELVFNKK